MKFDQWVVTGLMLAVQLLFAVISVLLFVNGNLKWGVGLLVPALVSEVYFREQSKQWKFSTWWDNRPLM